MNPREGVRPGNALLTVLATGLPSLLLLRVAHDRVGRWPELSWYALALLVPLIGLVLVMSWQIRRYVAGRSTVPPSPERARGTLVGAQAAALGGAGLLGWYAAQALVRVPYVDVVSERTQLWWAVAHALAALALSVAGFVGQHWCRLPPGEDEDGPGSGGRAPFTAPPSVA